MKDPEDEAFEELALKQGHWQHTSGWRKKQIMSEVQRIGQEIEQEPDYKLLFGELAEKFSLLLDEKKMWKKQALFRFDAIAPPQEKNT